MLDSGASRWLEPELRATVRMPAASAAVRAATRAVRRDIFPPGEAWGTDVGWCARAVPAAHACVLKSRRCEWFSAGQVEPAGLALHRDGVVEALERRLAPVADDVRAQRHD